ncbi:hypothetical protein AVEN_13515-1 [Araneus ventricosus]|uniref:Uncharacterized protein n=1 Tax=Araneus ventricosus TaxID=182803 RepID=A0A4Y2LLW2_ARAVE|nr:hypothetical protein AVEN_13515-1 [Araneus ventricosus]
MKETLLGIRFPTVPEILQAVDRSIRTINTTGAAKGGVYKSGDGSSEKFGSGATNTKNGGGTRTRKSGSKALVFAKKRQISAIESSDLKPYSEFIVN